MWTISAGTGCVMGRCAQNYGDITPGAICDATGLVCGYPDGTCNCASTLATVHGEIVSRWACVAAVAGCPSPRPDIGSACDADGRLCNYGACSGGIALKCGGGIWQEAFLPCAAQ